MIVINYWSSSYAERSYLWQSVH